MDEKDFNGIDTLFCKAQNLLNFASSPGVSGTFLAESTTV